MSLIIREYLFTVYPELKKYIERCPVIEEKRVTNDNVLEVLIKTIVGQMLSRKVALTISRRILSRVEMIGGYDFLTQEELTSCGVSKRKARAILLLIEKDKNNPSCFQEWQYLSYKALLKEVDACWGIGEWTAAMLAIFHFGKKDIFPDKDGTIQRAIGMLKANGIDIDPMLASPYQSYLALYLWSMIDNEIL